MPIGATNERHSTGDWSLESKCMRGAESIRTVNDVSSSSQRLCERGQLFSAAAEERKSAGDEEKLFEAVAAKGGGDGGAGGPCVHHRR